MFLNWHHCLIVYHASTMTFSKYFFLWLLTIIVTLLCSNFASVRVCKQHKYDCCMLCFVSDVLVSLERTFYFVSESSGTLEVCVDAPDLSKPINVTLLPINGSTEGELRVKSERQLICTMHVLAIIP